MFQDELELPPAKLQGVKIGGGIAGHNGLRSVSSHIGAMTTAGSGSGSVTPASRNWCTATCCSRISPRMIRPWVVALCEAICRQRRTACDRSGFDVPEQGASGDAGQGIFPTRAMTAAESSRDLSSPLRIFFRRSILQRGWIRGSSPRMTLRINSPAAPRTGFQDTSSLDSNGTGIVGLPESSASRRCSMRCY